MVALRKEPDRDRPLSLEEFDALDFGDRPAELIDGRVIVAQAFPSLEHGLVIENLSYRLRLALDAAGHDNCRPVATSAFRIRGLPHGLRNDSALGPDLTIHCRDDAGEWRPTLVVEVLSPSNSANEMADKLRAYRAAPSVEDILFLNQDKVFAVHHRRRDGRWLAGLDLEGPEAEIVIERWSARIALGLVYEGVFGDVSLLRFTAACHFKLWHTEHVFDRLCKILRPRGHCMRLHSTYASVESGEVSVLAVIETVLAVSIYWVISWYFDTHIHLLISILAAPLLLLRSPQSITLGVKWFREYANDDDIIDPQNTPRKFLVVIDSVIFAVAIFSFIIQSDTFIREFYAFKIFDEERKATIYVGYVAIFLPQLLWWPFTDVRWTFPVRFGLYLFRLS